MCVTAAVLKQAARRGLTGSLPIFSYQRGASNPLKSLRAGSFLRALEKVQPSDSRILCPVFLGWVGLLRPVRDKQ